MGLEVQEEMVVICHYITAMWGGIDGGEAKVYKINIACRIPLSNDTPWYRGNDIETGTDLLTEA